MDDSKGPMPHDAPNSELSDFLDDRDAQAPADLDDSDADTGARIAEAREAAGMEPEDLAGQLGVDVATVERWEAGDAPTRGNRLATIAGILGVSLSWLMIGHGVGPNDDEAAQLRGSLLALRRRLTHALNEVDQAVEMLAAPRAG